MFHWLGGWICRHKGKHIPGKVVGHSRSNVWFVCKRCGREFPVPDLESIIASILNESLDKYAAEIGRRMMNELFD
jgi:hypothetical protein